MRWWHVNNLPDFILSSMDLDGVKQESIESEFLAVILAGFGSE